MIQVREAKPGDEQDILLLIKELAVYEKEPDAVENTEEEIRAHLFEESICHALVAELQNEIIGFTLYYTSYSTWKGKCVYLEDLYVKESYRNMGAGTILFEHVISVAKSVKARRLDWQVYDWNKPAIDFYKKHNASIDGQWLNGRLEFDK